MAFVLCAKTIKDIEVNTYRYFFTILTRYAPHFTTYGKNYSDALKNKEVLAHIFSHVLHLRFRLIDPSEIHRWNTD